jgi:hypothetical protein
VGGGGVGGCCEILAAKGSLKGLTALELKSGEKEEKKRDCLLGQHKAFGERERDGEEMGSDI